MVDDLLACHQGLGWLLLDSSDVMSRLHVHPSISEVK
jgi:hypothetical protein